MKAAPEYHKLCKNGDRRTVMYNADICGPCFAALVMPSLKPVRLRAARSRRGTCKHCGKERQLDSRDLCKSKCARLDLDYPVVRGRGRKKATP